MLGENRPTAAMSFSRLCVVCAAMLGALTVGTLAVFGTTFFTLFTSDPTLQQHLRRALPALCVLHFLDSIQTVFQGIFRGVGQQATAAKNVLVTLWLIGLPIAFLLSVPEAGPRLGVSGILLGLSCGVVMLVFLFTCFSIRRFDWTAMAIAAQEEEKQNAENEDETAPPASSAPHQQGSEGEEEMNTLIVAS